MPETTRRAASDSRGVSAVIAPFFLAQRQRAGANADCDEYANRSQNLQQPLRTYYFGRSVNKMCCGSDATRASHARTFG
jgi:hypothetical protein